MQRNIYRHEISNLDVGSKHHIEIRRIFENCGAMPVETMRITTKNSAYNVSSLHCFQLMQMLRSHSFLMSR